MQSLPKYCTSNDQIITPILFEVCYSIVAVSTFSMSLDIGQRYTGITANTNETHSNQKALYYARFEALTETMLTVAHISAHMHNDTAVMSAQTHHPQT